MSRNMFVNSWRYRKRDNMIEKLQTLLEVEKILLASTNEQMSGITKNFLGLMDKMPKGEFYQAITLNGDGEFEMREGYNGYFVQVIKVLDASAKRLAEQKQQCIARIKQYSEKLEQLMTRGNALEPIPQVTNSVPTPSPRFMGQSVNMPTSPDNYVGQKEDTADKGIGRMR